MTCQNRSNSQKKIKIDCHDLPLVNLAITNQSQILRFKHKFAESRNLMQILHFF
ncbi:hypothetical protein ACWIUD_04000 [Helicobacter sp. 23-1044]